VLLMETEIWPRFIHEAKLTGAKVAIVNGRLSDKSFRRYSKVGSFIRAVLNDVDLALMQNEADAKRIVELGMNESNVVVTGNLKFEQAATETENELTESFRSRFGISPEMLLIIAASTHEPEEKYVVDALDGKLGRSCRLMVVPRHPERFDFVAKQFEGSGYSFVRRSSSPSDEDTTADVILLDSIGELRAAYPLAEIVFVGGSLIPHGGQSILEPATAGKAIVTGPHTYNFAGVVKEFNAKDAVIQIDDETGLKDAFVQLISTEDLRVTLGNNALATIRSNKNAAERIINYLLRLTDN
jgi:3-deoxy-D-manno-octulosonic-acid transferase